MTLTQLRYLSAIVDAGLNVTAAAQRLNATQSGVSKQIKVLEEELGFLLFVRRGKSLERLTSGGAEILEHVRALLLEAAKIRTVAGNHRGDISGELRIAATYTQSRYVLPAAMAAVRSRFPAVRFDLSPGAEAEALQALGQDQADLAVVSGSEKPSASDTAVALYRWNLVGVAPRDHPLARRGGRLTLEDIAAWPLVSYPAALEPGSYVMEAFGEAGLAPHVGCVARDSDLIKTFVRAGLGVGLMAEMAAGAADPDLAFFPLHGLFQPRTAWAVCSRERGVPDHLMALMLALVPRFGPGELRRMLEGGAEPSADPAPLWSEARHWLGDATLAAVAPRRIAAPPRLALAS